MVVPEKIQVPYFAFRQVGLSLLSVADVEDEARDVRELPLLIGEGLFRVLLFVGYLWLIGRTKDIHRVFEYHGAEHKTIAAYEHDEPLVPESVDKYSTLHVRCGTNFLLIVMILTIFVFTLFGTPGIWWRIGSRILAIPLIAGLAFIVPLLAARIKALRLPVVVGEILVGMVIGTSGYPRSRRATGRP